MLKGVQVSIILQKFFNNNIYVSRQSLTLTDIYKCICVLQLSGATEDFAHLLVSQLYSNRSKSLHFVLFETDDAYFLFCNVLKKSK